MKNNRSIRAVAAALWALLPNLAFAGDVTQWPAKISNTITPMAITMAAVSFVIVGMAHSTTVASEWAQRHEKTALRGAIFSVGATAIVNLIKNIFM